MIPKALWAGIVLVVAGFLALAGINVYQWTTIAPALAQERDLVIHTYDVITTARSLGAALAQAERGQRGFIITGIRIISWHIKPDRLPRPDYWPN